MATDMVQQLNQIAIERDIPVEELFFELEESLAVAYKKYIGVPNEVAVEVKMDREKLTNMFVMKEVVGEVMNHALHVDVVTARKTQPDAEIGSFVPVKVNPELFGRIAAQTFKQVLTQKMREAEHRRVTGVFAEKQHDIVTGTVVRREEQNVFIQVEKVEAKLPRWEQVPTEPYRINDTLKVYVLRVEDGRRGLEVIVSRTHPNLLRKLFDLEVPEIKEGLIEIKSVAREPGQRSKVSVSTTDERIDAVGACVGPRGSRVQAIVDELFDEKIDIVPYSEDAKTYIINALSPAKVNSIKLNEEERSAYVIVPDMQLSLAIGKGGQNVRLAAKLTDWKIDIRSEAQAAAEGGVAQPKAAPAGGEA
ncbi:MAG: transcription termination/antitermination protein NusA [Fimbriimonadaceae bacterium]|nr:transcription termination/antitermination protein NusA [Fimbriimonadaceae bacterium]